MSGEQAKAEARAELPEIAYWPGMTTPEAIIVLASEVRGLRLELAAAAENIGDAVLRLRGGA